jgi:RNA-binding protein 25
LCFSAFGFCEYEDPEATLRCIRLLNEWRIADKELVVKVDAKTKQLLDEYKRKKRQKANGAKKKEPKEPEEDGKDSDKVSSYDSNIYSLFENILYFQNIYFL